MRGNDWTREAIEAIACSELVRASDVLNARIVKLLQPYCNCRFIWQNPAGKPSGIGGVRLRTTNENGRQISAAAFVLRANPANLSSESSMRTSYFRPDRSRSPRSCTGDRSCRYLASSPADSD